MNFCDESKTIPNAEYRNVRGDKCTSTPSAEDMTTSAIESEVWHEVEELNKAFARNDVAKYFSYIDPNITVITPSNPYRVEGIEDDMEEFEYGLKNGSGRLGYFQEMQPKIQLFGDVAVVTYYSRGSYGPQGQEKGGMANGRSCTSTCLQRRDCGWIIFMVTEKCLLPIVESGAYLDPQVEMVLESTEARERS